MADIGGPPAKTPWTNTRGGTGVAAADLYTEQRDAAAALEAKTMAADTANASATAIAKAAADIAANKADSAAAAAAAAGAAAADASAVAAAAALAVGNGSEIVVIIDGGEEG